MVWYLAAPCRTLLLFYVLSEAFGSASSSLPPVDGLKATVSRDDNKTEHDERNITVGSSTTGALRAKRRQILPDPGPYDPSWPINQYKEDTPLQCECAKCNKKDIAKELASKAAKKAVRLHERQMAYVLSMARKECLALGLLGQIEIQASYCVMGVSMGSGAWTQLGKTREEGVYFPGGRPPSTDSVPELTDGEVEESGVFKRAVMKAVVGSIRMSLADMTQRADVWHDPEVFSHAAMDRSAITRHLVIAEPFLGSFKATLYFRLWLTDFPATDVKKDAKKEKQ